MQCVSSEKLDDSAVRLSSANGCAHDAPKSTSTQQR